MDSVDTNDLNRSRDKNCVARSSADEIFPLLQMVFTGVFLWTVFVQLASGLLVAHFTFNGTLEDSISHKTGSFNGHGGGFVQSELGQGLLSPPGLTSVGTDFPQHPYSLITLPDV